MRGTPMEEPLSMKRIALILIALILPVALAACDGLSSTSYNSTSDDPPRDLSARVRSTTTIHLEWTAPLSGVTAGYNIYRSDEGGPFSEVDTFAIDNGIVNSPSYDDNGLSGNETHCYKVSSYNSALKESKKTPTACAATPGILTTSPLNGATGVGFTNTNTVSVTFTDPFDTSTFTAGNLSLIVNYGGEIGNSVVGDLSFQTNSKAVFTPNASLLNSVKYKATVSSGVVFDDGSDYDDTYTWSFTTAP